MCDFSEFKPPLYHVQDGQSADLDGAAFPALGGTADGEPRTHGAAAAPAVWVSSWGGDGSTVLKERLAASEPTAAIGKRSGVSAAGKLQHASSWSTHPDHSHGPPVPWVATGEQAFMHCMLLLIHIPHAGPDRAHQVWIRSQCSLTKSYCFASQQVARCRSSMQRPVMRRGTMLASAMPISSRWEAAHALAAVRLMLAQSVVG